MWLYVPNISISSQSAPVDSASISASSWQFQLLEQSAWSRGKPSRSRNWYQQWKRAIWLQRLFGAMPEPSMAEHGVAQLTASLAAFRASLIASPAVSKARTTNAISGLTLAASSSNPERNSSSLKMSPACSRQGLTKSLAQSGFIETFESLVLRLRSDCSRRQKLARRTRESAFSSSQWRTPAANNGERGGMLPEEREGHTLNLQDQVQGFQASAWPTPTANDWKGSGPTLERKDGQMRGDRLDYATEQLWTTPSAGDGQRGGTITENMSGTSLVQQVNTLWSTPRASDGEKGEPNQTFGAGGQPLPAQTIQWMTPRSHEVGQYQYSRGDKTKPVETLTGQAPSHLAQVTVKTGKPHSKERRSLNPLFVEWLMGWPPGWTLLAWTDFGCSEMALFHWKQRMRCALLSLGLPAEAPPAQLALFG